jgi:RND family efflux transporter MFP subunit
MMTVDRVAPVLAAATLTLAIPFTSYAQGLVGQDQLQCMLEPNTEIELSAAAEGVLKRVRVNRGDTVKKGQVVAELTSGSERAAVDLAKAREEFGKRKEARNEQLYREKLISIHQKDEIDTELVISQMQRRQAEEQLKMRMVTSPIDGVVVERDKDPGEYVENDSLLTIVSLNPLHVEVVVPEAKFGTITEGMAGEITTLGPLNEKYQAQVTLVDKLIDAASGTFRVRLGLDNPGNEIPAGLNCMVSFIPAQQADELLSQL